YATATPLALATRNLDIASRSAAYGVPGVAVDGNDVITGWHAMQEAVERAKNGEGPTLIEAKTYRTVGHHEGDPLVGTYRTQEELDEWQARWPIASFRQFLLTSGAVAPNDLSEIDERVESSIAEALEFARRTP